MAHQQEINVYLKDFRRCKKSCFLFLVFSERSQQSCRSATPFPAPIVAIIAAGAPVCILYVIWLICLFS